MFSEVKELFQNANTEQELLDIVHTLCDPYGAVVKTDILWSALPRQIMCLVEMPDMQSAHTVASRCGTMTFGQRHVVFKYEASPDFCNSHGNHLATADRSASTPPA